MEHHPSLSMVMLEQQVRATAKVDSIERDRYYPTKCLHKQGWQRKAIKGSGTVTWYVTRLVTAYQATQSPDHATNPNSI